MGRGVPLPLCGDGFGKEAVLLPRNFCLHFHVEMARFGGILAANFKFHSMNKTVTIHQNRTDTSEYHVTREANSKIGCHSLLVI